MPVAVLTGSGRPGQVGEAVATRLAADGYELLLVDRDPALADTLAARMRAEGAVATSYAADLSDPTAVAQLFEAIGTAHGNQLDALVHLAGGFGMSGSVADTPVADWEKQLSINLRTAFLVARAGIPMLRERHGSLIFFSSESALSGAKVSGIAAYAVAKSGVLSLAMAVSQEEAKFGLRANVLAPAAIRTAANAADMPRDSKFVEREDVAAAVSWLCSPEAAAVTGQVIRLSPR
jgi:3-oxoacyl-[acyl-carrier protein] reductase